MGRVQQIAEATVDIKDFAGKYLENLSGLINALDMGALASFVRMLDEARAAEATVFIVGNGGSAATASHMANDLGVDVGRSLSGGKSFRAVSLVDNPAVIMAIANDESYEQIFVNQLRTHVRTGDVLIAISASGNSLNVVKAARWMKDHKHRVLSLVGFDGGELGKISDVAVCVKSPKGDYGPVEDVHMIIDHLVANWFRYKK